MHNTSLRPFLHVLPCRRTMRFFFCVRLGFSHPGNFSVAVAEIRDSNISLLIVNAVVRNTYTLSASEIYMTEKLCWFAKINKFHQFLRYLSQVLLSSQPFSYHRRVPIRAILVCGEQKDIPSSVVFSHPSSNRTSSNCLS